MENTYLLHILDSESASSGIFFSVLFGELFMMKQIDSPKAIESLPLLYLNKLALDLALNPAVYILPMQSQLH